jgi:TetR/AcrR family transcriptional regulator, transcriptional repressor for nem operon
MARPRAFDEDDVLERAMQAFWAHGYERTSLEALLASTALSKSSLYGAFGDKHRLFICTLERYAAQQKELAGDALGGALSGALGGDRALREQLRRFLARIAADSVDPASPGCMMVNAVADFGHADPDVRRVSRANSRALCKVIELAIARAQERGEFAHKLNAADAAAFVAGVIAGFRIQGRSGVSKESLLRQVDLALQVFDG